MRAGTASEARRARRPRRSRVPPGARRATPAAAPALALVGIALAVGALAARPAFADGAPGADAIVRVLLGHAYGAVSIELPGGGAQRVGASTRAWESTRAGRHAVDVAGTRFEIDGRIRVRATREGLAVIALLPLETYLEGTVGREMPTSWEPAALRAQAIVSRTYALRALREPADPSWDVAATTASQVFGGAAAATPSVREAVRATRGLYLSFDGAPILAYFHSASGGRTAASEEVWGRPVAYLPSVAVADEEEAPSTYWRASVSRTKLRRALGRLGLEVGRIDAVRVAERWPSGRVRRIEVRGEAGVQSLSGTLWREVLGPDVVKSTLFELRERGDDLVLVGSGHGHGVGMSQWGAKGMAARGASHREILATFYPGATLEAMRGAMARSAGADAMPAVASGGER